MTCEIGVALIGLLFVLIIGFGLVLAEIRRAKSCDEYRGHIPPRPIPAAKDLPPPPPKKKD